MALAGAKADVIRIRERCPAVQTVGDKNTV
jgi:hypothetical protein